MTEKFAMYYYSPRDGLIKGIAIAKKQFCQRYGLLPTKVEVRQDEYVEGCGLPITCVEKSLQPHCFRLYDILARQPVVLTGARVCASM